MNIQEMYLQGVSISEIVRRTGHKRYLVEAELDRLGVTRRNKYVAARNEFYKNIKGDKK